MRIVPAFLLGLIFILLPFLYWKDLPDPCLNLRMLFIAIGGCIALAGLIYRSGPVVSSVCLLSRKGLVISFSLLSVLAFMSCCWSRNPGDALSQWLYLNCAAAYVVVYASIWNRKPDIQKWLTLFAASSACIYLSLFVCKFWPDFIASVKLGAWPVIRYEHGGTAGNKNYLAELLLLNLFFMLPGLSAGKTKVPVFLWTAAVLSTLLIVILQSVTAIAALVAGLAYFAYATGKKRIAALFGWKSSVLILFALIMIAALTCTSIGDKIKTIPKVFPATLDITSANKANNSSIYERSLMWRNSFRIIEEHPVSGVGLNGWKIEQARYGIGGNTFLNTGMERFEHPHNEFLLLAAELGIPGLLLGLSILYLLLKHKREDENMTLTASRAALMALCIVCLFSYPLHREVTMMLAAIHVSVLVASPKIDIRYPSKAHILDLLFVFFFMFAGLVFAYRLSGDYHLGQGMAAQLDRKSDRALSEYALAGSSFYTLDANGTPLEWYEGNQYFRSGNFKRTIEVLEKGRAKNPFHVRLLNDLGTAYEQAGRHDSAVSCYHAALHYCPGLIETRLNLAAALYNAYDVKSAYEALRGIINPLALKGRDLQSYRLYKGVIVNEMLMNDLKLEKAGVDFEALKKSSTYEEMIDLCFTQNENPDDFLQCVKIQTESMTGNPAADEVNGGGIH